MDDHEEELNKIFEHVQKEIPYGIFNIIVDAQEKFHNNKDGNLGNNKENGLRKIGKETKNVGTMADGEQIPEDPVSSKGSNGENEKQMTAAEKQAAKKRLAEEKREMQLVNKMYKPGECMKHMTVEIHPTLSSAWYAADIAREVTAASAKLRVSAALCSPALVLWSRGTAPTLTAESGLILPSTWYAADIAREVTAASAKLRVSAALCSPALVLWSRGTAPTLTTESGLLELAPTHHKCDRALYVTTADEVSEFVAAKNLSQTVHNMRELTGCELTLVVFGVDDYFKPPGRKRNNQRQQMTEIELEMALTDLLVTVGCDTIKVDTPNELALTIVHFTKAIAEAPYKQAKRQCDEQAQFYMRGDNKNCVAINKNGAGLGKLWQQMLAILPMSSLERSRALCAKYSSPKQLYEELLTPSGVATVADIGVPRSAVPGSVARRTGGEFARKLQILLTADDGDTLVQ